MSESGTPMIAALDPVRISLVSVSDRASSGVYEDKGIPALQAWLQRAVRNPIAWETRLVPDEQALISAALREPDGALATRSAAFRSAAAA